MVAGHTSDEGHRLGVAPSWVAVRVRAEERRAAFGASGDMPRVALVDDARTKFVCLRARGAVHCFADSRVAFIRGDLRLHAFAEFVRINDTTVRPIL